MTRRPSRVVKALQQHCLTFMSSKWGMTLVVLCGFASATVFVLAVLTFVVPQLHEPDVWSDNLAGRSFRAELAELPIDIVYTWVNGSDPRHSIALSAFKAQLLQLENQTNASTTTTPISTTTIPVNATVKTENKQDDAAASRFQDNDELRYSLRSVERFAPWVRKIWIVTNGQVPAWLDLRSPRITVVTHAEIFLNSSHLPTFSSPAIETHLHQIPGLSPRFIYLNDDVMFGAPVWPDDFRSVSNGQKVFLSWPVPNCAEGCPSNWVGDGYCDRSCNNTDCDFDGGDCLGNRSSTAGPSWSTPYQQTDTGDAGALCAKSCPDNWLGDKFCDRSCNTRDCGFDATDCGADTVFSGLPGFAPIVSEGNVFSVPRGELAAYFNLSGLLGDINGGASQIVDGDHDNTTLVRMAVVSKQNSLMVVVFHKNVSRTTTRLTLQVQIGSSLVNRSFSVSADTIPLPKPNISDAPTSSSTTHQTTTTTTLAATQAGGRTLLSIIPPATGTASPSLLHGAIPVPNGTAFTPGTTPSPTPGTNESAKKKIDTFGESLKYVNRLYSKEFGAEARKVPAHMPHFIDVSIMSELQARWPERWAETSSHQLRSSHDMQYSFSYFYYLIDAPMPFNATQLWRDIFDVNHDGTLNDNEFRTLSVHLLPVPVKDADLMLFRERMINCTHGQWPLTLELVQSCNESSTMLHQAFAKKRKYRHEIRDTDEVAFIMVANNDSSLQSRLDGIRLRRHKFICLNDNLNHSNPTAGVSLQLLHDFYESLFPLRSVFELPDGVTNEFLHVDEIRLAQYAQRIVLLTNVALASLVLLVALCMLRCWIVTARQKRHFRELRYLKFTDV